MRKRIAIIIHSGIGSGFFSQGQPVIVKLVEQLSIDFEVTVYTQFPPNKDATFKAGEMFSPPRGIKFVWLRWILLIGSLMVHQIKKPYDLFYAFWGYPAGFIAVLSGNLFNKPSVIHLQGGDATSIPMFRYGAFYRSLSRKICSWAYEKASLVVALTQFQKENLEKHGIKRAIEVIPYGPDLTMFLFRANKFKNELIKFIHIGNHSPLKDQKMLLNAFDLICRNIKCHLSIIGYDALNGELKMYANELGIDKYIEFIEPCPYRRIPEYLSTADVMLHTSLYEGQATVVSEAAACGVLLAGTRIGLLYDLGDDYGVVVNVGDSKGLAEKVLKVVRDRSEINRYIKKARAWAEHYDEEYTTQTIKSHLNHLLKISK